MKIVKYEIVTAYSRERFLEDIDEGLAKGWQPFGSPCMVFNKTTNQWSYAQAMVRYAEEEAL